MESLNILVFWRMNKFQECKVILIVNGWRLWSVIQDLYEPIRSYLAQLKGGGKWLRRESIKRNSLVCYVQGNGIKKLVMHSERIAVAFVESY